MSGPTAIMRALGIPGLTSTEARVFAYYVGRANGAKVCWPSVKETSDDLGGLPERTIKAANHGLQQKGWLRVQRRLNDSNHYHICDKDGWLYNQPIPPQGQTLPLGGADIAPVDQEGVQNLPLGGAKSAPKKEDSSKTQESLATPVSRARAQGGLFPQEEPPPPPPKVRKPQRRAEQIPEDWQPEDAASRYAVERGVDPVQAAEEFRNYWLGCGKPMKDWQSTFRNRVLVLAERGRFPYVPAPKPRVRETEEERRARWARQTAEYEAAAPERLRRLAQVSD